MTGEHKGEPRLTRLVPGRDVPARYARVSGDFSAVHLDDESARRVGLPGVILHGMYLFGLAVRAAAREIDDDPRRVRSATAQFRAPAVPDTELVIDLGRGVTRGEEVERSVHMRQGDIELLANAKITLLGPVSINSSHD